MTSLLVLDQEARRLAKAHEVTADPQRASRCRISRFRSVAVVARAEV